MSDDLRIRLDLMKPPSLNAYYSGGHWTKRKKAKDMNLAHIITEFDKFDNFIADEFEIHLMYNGRYDCDNAIIAVKFLSDAIVHQEFVADDSKKFFKRLSITVNPELKSDTYIAEVRFKNVTYL